MTTHSKRVCTSCGKEALRDEALFCRDCGTPLTNRCTQCDAVLEDDEGYCEFCGAESYYKAHKLDPFADDEMEDPTSYATNELPDDLPF